MKQFLVALKQEHSVTEFGEINGILYEANSHKEVLEKLRYYIEYMENETNIDTLSFEIRELSTDKIKNVKIDLKKKRNERE